jgi:hypothetical protein
LLLKPVAVIQKINLGLKASGSVEVDLAGVFCFVNTTARSPDLLADKRAGGLAVRLMKQCDLCVFFEYKFGCGTVQNINFTQV